MTVPVGPPNLAQLYRCQTGVETARGTKVTKTNRWYGMLALQRRHQLADSEEYSGTFFADLTPTRGPAIVDGTYYQLMTYEDPQLLRYAMAGGVSGSDDGNTTHGYTYTFRHSGSRDDLDTFSAEDGHPIIIFESEACFFPEFTISGDIDDPQGAWKWNSRVIGIRKELKAVLEDVAGTGGSTTTFVKSAWGQTIDALIGRWMHIKSATQATIDELWREVLDNDATSLTFTALPATMTSGDVIDLYPAFTSGISDRTRETIKGPGTKLYIDAHGGTIGTNQVTGRFISFSVTSQLNASFKRFMENVDELSSRVDRGMVRVTGQLKLEFDRRYEWDKYTDLGAVLLRIKQEGSTIDTGAGTKKAATIDVYEAVFDDPVMDRRGNNNTVTIPFRGYMDEAGQAVPLQIAIKNTQSALLA